MTIQQARTLIEQERERQDERWGGPAHDDSHSPDEWRAYIAEHTAKALAHVPPSSAVASRIVEVAALGYAAIDAAVRAMEG